MRTVEDEISRYYCGYPVVVMIMYVKNKLGSGIEDDNMMAPNLLLDILCKSVAESRRKPRSRISNSSNDDEGKKSQ